MAKIILCAVALVVSNTTIARQLVFNSGDSQVTLLELYTSQGCSSCPPAERWLNTYINSDDLWSEIVPLAFHVDYWDYLGWKDTLAAKSHGERQRDYARAGKARTVYTPGMFANGREWRGWTFLLKPRESGREPGNLAVTITDEMLTATFPESVQPLELHVAILGFGIETAIERGENRNRSLKQEFVVLAHEMHDASENGRWIVRLPMANYHSAGRLGLAVWVSETGKPAPLQATGGWLDQAPQRPPAEPH